MTTEKMTEPKNYLTALITEFLGTFLLVFITSWSYISLESEKIDYLTLSLINGLSLTALLCSGFPTSGAHYNPIITITNLTIKNMKFQIGMFYILTQLTASFVAGLLVHLMLSNLDSHYKDIGYPKIIPIISEFQAFVMEFVFSFFYVLMYFSTVFDKRSSSNTFGFAMGSVVVLGSCVFGPFSGGCGNPVRAFGPELISGGFNVIYWFGCLLGGLFGGFYYEYFLLKNRDFDMDEDEDVGSMRTTENYNLAMNLKY